MTDNNTITATTILKSQNPELFKELSWVLLARSKDEFRPHLSGCLIKTEGDNKIIAATNGASLHQVTYTGSFSTGLPDGNYTAITVNKDVIALTPNSNEFPKYEHIMPVKKTQIMTIELRDLPYKRRKKHADTSWSILYTRMVRAIKHDDKFTISIDALKLSIVDDENFNVFHNEAGDPVLFENEKRMFLIGGLRM